MNHDQPFQPNYPDREADSAGSNMKPQVQREEWHLRALPFQNT